MLYDATIIFRWGDSNFPAHYPIGAHTGNMVLLSHDGTYSLFQVGRLASQGIVETSMEGTLDGIMEEVQDNPHILSVLTEPTVHVPATKNLGKIAVDAAHPYVSFVTMVAPSPDWFAGVSSVDMYRGNDGRTVDLDVWAYDAGSDYGKGFYNAPDFPEMRRKPIKYLVERAMFSGPPCPIATLRLVPTKR